jgi:hypothetical protein
LTSSGSAATIIRCPRRAANRLVTNGLGGFASSTISGEITRRYHGVLIAALPAPQGASESREWMIAASSAAPCM